MIQNSKIGYWLFAADYGTKWVNFTMGHPKECPCVFRLLFISTIQNMLNKSVEVRRLTDRPYCKAVLTQSYKTGANLTNITSHRISPRTFTLLVSPSMLPHNDKRHKREFILSRQYIFTSITDRNPKADSEK